MSDLFDTDDETSAMTEAPPELATIEQIRILEGFGYRREATRKWTQEKAQTVIRKNQREERLALDRANRTAREQDGPPHRTQPSALERVVAADYLEQAQEQGVDELLVALMHSLWVSTDDELKRFAVFLVRVWKP